MEVMQVQDERQTDSIQQWPPPGRVVGKAMAVD
jgi:hypothetical protein